MGATSTPALIWIPDQYETIPAQLDSPAAVFYAITTSDSARLPKRPRAVFVGVAGDIVATGSDGVDVTLRVNPPVVLSQNCIVACTPTVTRAVGKPAGL